jgi:hypothetical protein
MACMQHSSLLLIGRTRISELELCMIHQKFLITSITNRGPTDRFPIAGGGKGLLSFEGSEKHKIVDRCRSVVSKMIDMCQDARGCHL